MYSPWKSYFFSLLIVTVVVFCVIIYFFRPASESKIAPNESLVAQLQAVTEGDIIVGGATIRVVTATGTRLIRAKGLFELHSIEVSINPPSSWITRVVSKSDSDYVQLLKQFVNQ